MYRARDLLFHQRDPPHLTTAWPACPPWTACFCSAASSPTCETARAASCLMSFFQFHIYQARGTFESTASR